MPERAGPPLVDWRAVLTPPHSLPSAYTTWFMRTSLALIWPSESPSAAPSGLGPVFWSTAMPPSPGAWIGRSSVYVSVRSCTRWMSRLGLLLPRERVPVTTQALIAWLAALLLVNELRKYSKPRVCWAAVGEVAGWIE